MPRETYGIGSAIGEIGAVGQEISRYNALPPLKKNLFRAGGGADMMSALVRTPMAPREIWKPVAAWAAMLAFGLLWFVVGIKGARGPRDVMQAFWALILNGIYAALLWWEVYPPRDWGAWAVLANFLLQGVYIAGIVGSLVRFWLSVRGLPGEKLEAVKAQQEHGRARDATEAEAAEKFKAWRWGLPTGTVVNCFLTATAPR